MASAGKQISHRPATAVAVIGAGFLCDPGARFSIAMRRVELSRLPRRALEVLSPDRLRHEHGEERVVSERLQQRTIAGLVGEPESPLFEDRAHDRLGAVFALFHCLSLEAGEIAQ